MGDARPKLMHGVLDEASLTGRCPDPSRHQASTDLAQPSQVRDVGSAGFPKPGRGVSLSRTCTSAIAEASARLLVRLWQELSSNTVNVPVLVVQEDDKTGQSFGTQSVVHRRHCILPATTHASAEALFSSIAPLHTATMLATPLPSQTWWP